MGRQLPFLYIPLAGLVNQGPDLPFRSNVAYHKLTRPEYLDGASEALYGGSRGTHAITLSSDTRFMERNSSGRGGSSLGPVLVVGMAREEEGHSLVAIGRFWCARIVDRVTVGLSAAGDMALGTRFLASCD